MFVLAILGCPLMVSLGFTAWVVFGVLRGEGSPGRFELARFKSMLSASGYYALFNISNTVSVGTGTIIVGIGTRPSGRSGVQCRHPLVLSDHHRRRGIGRSAVAFDDQGDHARRRGLGAEPLFSRTGLRDRNQQRSQASPW